MRMGAPPRIGGHSWPDFVSAEHYRGATLVYLAHYVDPLDAAWTASPDELLAAVEPSLRVLNADYDRRWVRDIHVTRDRFALPVPIASPAAVESKQPPADGPADRYPTRAREPMPSRALTADPGTRPTPEARDTVEAMGACVPAHPSKRSRSRSGPSSGRGGTG